jgi:hypothetical protein
MGDIKKFESTLKENTEEVSKLKTDVSKVVLEIPNISQGIADIKGLLTPMGERLARVESESRVCCDTLRDFLLESRAKEYRARVEDKLSRPASLVFSRPNGSNIPAPTSEVLQDFITDEFVDGEAPDFTLEPIGTHGSFKLYPDTFSPLESRRVCAAVLKAVSGEDIKKKKEDLKSKLGLNVFYDNPFFLREIRSSALRFVAQMLQDQGLKLTGKPFVKRDVMVLNNIPMFPEYLVPSDEALWPPCFPLLGNILRSSRSPPEGAPPLALSILEDAYVASKGLLFPKFTPEEPMHL